MLVYLCAHTPLRSCITPCEVRISATRHNLTPSQPHEPQTGLLHKGRKRLPPVGLSKQAKTLVPQTTPRPVLWRLCATHSSRTGTAEDVRRVQSTDRPACGSWRKIGSTWLRALGCARCCRIIVTFISPHGVRANHHHVVFICSKESGRTTRDVSVVCAADSNHGFTFSSNNSSHGVTGKHTVLIRR